MGADVVVRTLSNSRIRPELSLWMQAIGGSVREWRGRRELRHRCDDSLRAGEPQYYDSALLGGLAAGSSLSATPVAVMVPAP
jgi:hypothetical protein